MYNIPGTTKLILWSLIDEGSGWENRRRDSQPNMEELSHSEPFKLVIKILNVFLNVIQKLWFDVFFF